MEMIRKALGPLVLGVFLVLMAAPVFVHDGSNDAADPNVTLTSSITDDSIALGILQNHESSSQ